MKTPHLTFRRSELRRQKEIFFEPDVSTFVVQQYSMMLQLTSRNITVARQSSTGIKPRRTVQ